MHHRILLLISLLMVKMLGAQMVVGVSGLFEQPIAKSQGINLYSAGGVVSLDYRLFADRISAGGVWQYKIIPNLPSLSFNAYLASISYFPLKTKQNMPYLSGRIGYCQSNETISFPDGTSLTFYNDGAIVSPAIGLLSSFRFISGLFWDFTASYTYYFDERSTSGIGIGVGFKYFFNQKE